MALDPANGLGTPGADIRHYMFVSSWVLGLRGDWVSYTVDRTRKV